MEPGRGKDSGSRRGISRAGGQEGLPSPCPCLLATHFTAALPRHYMASGFRKPRFHEVSRPISCPAGVPTFPRAIHSQVPGAARPRGHPPAALPKHMDSPSRAAGCLGCGPGRREPQSLQAAWKKPRLDSACVA